MNTPLSTLEEFHFFSQSFLTERTRQLFPAEAVQCLHAQFEIHHGAHMEGIESCDWATEDHDLTLCFTLRPEGLVLQDGCVLFRPTTDPEVKLVGPMLQLRFNEGGMWLEYASPDPETLAQLKREWGHQNVIFSDPRQWDQMLQWSIEVPDVGTLENLWVEVWQHPDLYGYVPQGDLDWGTIHWFEATPASWAWKGKTDVDRGVARVVGRAVECAQWMEPADHGYRFCFALPLVPEGSSEEPWTREEVIGWMDSLSTLAQQFHGTHKCHVKVTSWMDRKEFVLDPALWEHSTRYTQPLRESMWFTPDLLPSDQATTVIVDQTVQDWQSLFDAYGKWIYVEERKHLNPIFEDSTYFGTNFDAFWDCLTSIPQDVGTHLQILHRGLPEVETAELAVYLELLLAFKNGERKHPITFLEVSFTPDLQEKVERALVELEKTWVWGRFNRWSTSDDC